MNTKQPTALISWEAEIFRVFAENVSDCTIFVVDHDRRVVSWNIGAEHLLGYTTAEIVGQSGDILFTPEDRHDGAPQRELDHAQMVSRCESDCWQVRKDGSRFRATTITTALRDAGGSLRGFAKIVRDHTAIWESENAKFSNQQRYRAVVDDQTEVVCRLRADGTFVFVNPAFCRLVGKSANALLGQRGESVAHPDDVPHVEAALATLSAANPVVRIENRVINTAGEIRWMEFVNRGFFNTQGALTDWQAVGRDVTDRKRMEDQLARDSFLLASVQDSITVTNLDGIITYWNEGSTRLFGWTADEMLGQPITRRVPEAGRQAMAEAIQAIRDGKEFAGEWEDWHKDQSRIWIDARTTRITDTHGQPVGILGIARDITAKKKLEVRLREAEKFQAIGLLAGGIGHEFNNLLTVIQGFTQVLFSGLNDQDPATEFLGHIQNAADRAATLTRQLLAFSQRQMTQPRSLDLNTVIGDLVPALRGKLSPSVTVVTDLAKNLGRVVADPAQLEEVITSLASNAQDAMPGGGVITIATRDITLSAAELETGPKLSPGRYSILSVTDTGQGMDEQSLAHVFEPFFTSPRPGLSTGLGLAAVYGIALKAGGHVEAQSEPGKGSTFRVYLPALPDPLPASTSLPGNTPTPGSGATVLLAEDNIGVRELTRHLLTSQGFVVLEAESGEQALELAEGHPDKIELLVTDVVMPGLLGPELAARLARTRPGIPVLFLSGYADDAVVRHGLLEPGSNFLQKPFTQLAFINKVQSILQRNE